jgi:hypothetical protein
MHRTDMTWMDNIDTATAFLLPFSSIPFPSSSLPYSLFLNLLLGAERFLPSCPELGLVTTSYA